VRLLSARLAKHLGSVLEGNYNPYSKEQAAEDVHLKQTLEKHHAKLDRMEKSKYRKPLFSEAMLDLAGVLAVRAPEPSDALSRAENSLERSVEAEDAEKHSLFSKYTASKRPAGFFGTAVGDAHQHSDEVAPVKNRESLKNEKH